MSEATDGDGTAREAQLAEVEADGGSDGEPSRTDWERVARQHIGIELEMLGDETSDAFMRLGNAVRDEDATAALVFACFGKPFEAEERLLDEPVSGLARDLDGETVEILRDLNQVSSELLWAAEELNRVKNGDGERCPDAFAYAAETLREVADDVEAAAPETEAAGGE